MLMRRSTHRAVALSKVLRLRPAARDDLDAAARWSEDQEPGLGRQFLAEVRRIQPAISARAVP